ncbi:MAG: hypothetical protein CL677_02215 [Bdellovibrionaceae bacterium]|nr:hypothetical protein [Pseudobdellovibrionaceae bacterium]|tara:strand:- start:79564 stop:79959 length:396 start_codon:yes stop_codon:yes gene_type:complete
MIKPMIFILISTLFLVNCESTPKEKSLPAASENITEKPIKNLPCHYQGTVPMWQNYFCREKMGIKERSSKRIVKCELELNDSLYGKKECEKLQVLKTKTCELHIKLSYYTKGLQTCLKDSKIETYWLRDYL